MKATPEEIQIVEETFSECMHEFMRCAAGWHLSFVAALKEADLKFPVGDYKQYAKEAFMHNMMTFYNTDIEMDGIVDEAKDILNPDK